MRVIIVGDFSTPQRTAAALAQAFVNVWPDAVVDAYPENRAATWAELSDPRVLSGASMLVWSKSRDLSARYDQHAVLAAARAVSVPTVAYHLDLWWGLTRASEVADDPFFRCDHVVTTDGGHDRLWEDAGVNHHWLPPATSVADTQWVPRPRPDAAGKVVFVGTWDGYAHPEWKYRRELISGLRRRLGPRMAVYPTGRDRVVGQDLADIIAASSFVVGDSCTPDGAGRYWSDRVPITLGMGGLLVHPAVDGMDEFFDDRHFISVRSGIDAMVDMVTSAESRPDDPRREAGRRAVIEGHTFDVRVRQIADLVG